MDTSAAGTENTKGVRFYLPIQKRDDAKRMVYGYASTEAVDSEGDTITLDAMKGSLPGYMKFANIREMHQLSAVGVAKEAEVDTKGLWIGAHVVDDDAWKKVQSEVYKGFSVGGTATSRDPQNKRIITGLDLIEISLVDRPSNPEALIEVIKAGHLAPEFGTAPEVVEPAKEGETKLDPSTLTEAQVEKKARELCAAAGEAPDKIVAKGGRGLEIAAWQRYVKAARDELTGPVADAKAVIVADAGGAGTLAIPADKIAAAKAVIESVDDAPDRKPPEATAEEVERAAAVQNLMLSENAKRLRTHELRKIKSLGDVCRALGVKEDLAKAVVAFMKTDGGPKLHLEDEAAKAAAIDVTIQALDPKAVKKALEEKTEEIADKVGKADKKDKPEGDYGSHEDAGYADPGYQSDGKPRYPLKEGGAWSEKRIRAAWNYIAQAKNAKKYSSEQVASIKKKIIAAWKAHIDKDGPPSADDGKKKAQSINRTEDNEVSKKFLESLGKADASKDIRKGLYAATCAISLLEQFSYLHSSLAAEAEVEDDDSPVPERMMQLLEMLASLVEEVVEEEIDEMLSMKEAADLPTLAKLAGGPLKLAASTTTKADFLDRLRKAIGDKTGHANFELLMGLVDTIEKADGGVAQTQEWGDRPGGQEDDNDSWGAHGANKVAYAQRVHDKAVAMGATCSMQKAKKKPAEEDGDGKDGEGDGEDKEDAKKTQKSKSKHEDPKNKDGEGDGKDDEEGEDGEDGGKKSKKTKKAAGITTEQLAEALVTVSKQLGDLTDIVTKGRRDPAKPATLRVVEKGSDADDVKKGDEGKPAATKEDVLKAALSRPNFITR